jgi:hypothetical protein
MLVEVLCRESHWSHQEVKLMYSLAIVRFVNGLVDLEQRRVVAQSVLSLADRLGIPLWLVDLRHQATHDSLPSVPILRMAAETAVDWLRDHYWTIKSNEESEISSVLLKILIRYKSNRKVELRKQGT